MAKHLIVRLRNWIGDVVLGVPSLVALEQAGYSLVLIGKSWAPKFFAGYSWPVLVKPQSLSKSVSQLRQLRLQLRASDQTFEQRINAIVYPTSFSSALEMRVAGLKAIGYSQELRGFLLNKRVPIIYGGHALVSYWELTQQFLNATSPPPHQIDLRISQADQDAADSLLQRHGIRSGFICIVPYAGGTFEKLDKRWPQFPAFLKLLSDAGLQVVTCPGPGEEAIAHREFSSAKILPNVSLGQYLGVLKRARLVVSNDTGPGHMAAAVGAPLISVLGPTKPEQWAPWGSKVNVVSKHPNWPDEYLVMQQAKKKLDESAN
jgi:heptosyltransferase II